MIWWYKDIFISRSSNAQIEQQTFKSKSRTRTMAKAYTKLKTVIQCVIEYQRNRRMHQHSYRVLTQLDDYHLADIGLIDEDLHVLAKGKTPPRFRRTETDEIKPAAVRLVSINTVASKNSKDSLLEPAYFDKVA